MQLQVNYNTTRVYQVVCRHIISPDYDSMQICSYDVQLHVRHKMAVSRPLALRERSFYNGIEKRSRERF